MGGYHTVEGVFWGLVVFVVFIIVVAYHTRLK
jgi:hypothetical protein